MTYRELKDYLTTLTEEQLDMPAVVLDTVRDEIWSVYSFGLVNEFGREDVATEANLATDTPLILF